MSDSGEDLRRLREELERADRDREALERQLTIERTVSFVSACFVGVRDVDLAIARSLERMGQTCEASRAQVFLLRAGDRRLDNTHEWCAEGVPPQMHNLQDLSVDAFPWFLERLRRGDMIHIPDVERMPAAASSEQAILEAQQVRALLIMPLIAGRRLLGFAGFDDVEQTDRWSDRDLTVLRSAVDTLGSALEGQRVDRVRREVGRHGEFLRGALADMAHRPDLGAVIQRLLDGINALIPFHGAYALILTDDERLIRYGWHGGFEANACQSHLEVQRALVREIRRTGAPAVRVSRNGAPCTSPTCQTWPSHRLAAIPVRMEDEIRGCLLLCSPDEGAFSPEELALASAFAAEAGLAIENARLVERIQIAATTDALTGVCNRGHLYDLGIREVSRCRRYGHPLSTIMIDLDNFKQINDVHGHHTGDLVLAKVAELCVENLRDSDVVGRYGGDEFAVLLPETDLEAATQTAERLRATVAAQSVSGSGGEVDLSASFGVAALDDDEETLEGLLERADGSLFDAKRGGRDRVETDELPQVKGLDD
jgi:eukaryotic-like serine/threonine-protein kinase